MTIPSYSIANPRLDWCVLGSYYASDESPAAYEAYLILWDADQHGEGWFGDKFEGCPEDVVSVFDRKHLHEGHPDAFVIHTVKFNHHEVSAQPKPLTDSEVIRLACQRLNRPVDFGKAMLKWRSIQEIVLIDMGICIFYHALFLTVEEDRYMLTLARLCRGDWEDFESPEMITPADCRDDDECVTVVVPQCGFRAEYSRSLRQVYEFDSCWRTANVVAISRRIAEERESRWMPALGDALEDAGCTSEVILAHCRGAGSHAHRCWVLDLILGMAAPFSPTDPASETDSPESS
jgi:hypothetical protein